tara:strand:- start:14169 stop:15665 length:1497 start_codon:yes stop_codon:yes gene_type:complete
MILNIQQLIEDKASKDGYENEIAVTQIKSLKTTINVTYKQLFKLVNNTSNHLKKLNIKNKDIIYISSKDSLNFIITFLGAIKVGIIPVPGNPELDIKQKKQIIENSNPKLIIDDDEKKFGQIQHIKTKKWQNILLENITTPNKFYKPKNNTPAFIIYSSGTTSIPKGIVHTHLSIQNTTYLHKKILKIQPNEKIYTTSKLFFAYALGNNFFAPFLLGINSIFNDCSIAIKITNIIRDYKPSCIFSVPTMYRRILRNKKENHKYFKKVKYFISAGERVPDKLYKEWYKATETTLLNCYGTSETLAIVIASRPKKEKIGSTGKPIKNIMTKLITRKGLNSRNNGVLYIKHKSFSKEYINNNIKNNKTFKSGWINTGDIWKIKNNNWYFEGREDDLIKVASKWVNPKEIEKLVHNIEGVLDAFCITTLSKEETNRIALFIYTKNKKNNEVKENIIKKVKNLPNYKKPYWIKIIDKLPQTSTGKIKRNILKEMIKNEKNTTL